MPHLEFHPLASIFPLMDDGPLAALAEDIEANGLREKIWIYEGKILDGRNRYRACVLKGIDHRTEQYRGKDPLGFVISMNLHRRHLDETQRAMAAARFALMQIYEGKPVRQTVDAAALLFVVSPRSVDNARKVLDKGTPSLIADVDAGRVTVTAAAKTADPPAEKPGPETKPTPDPEPEEAADTSDEETVVETPAVQDGPAGPQLTFTGVEGNRKVVASAARHLRTAREQLSEILAGPFRELILSLAKQHGETVAFQETERTVDHSIYGSYKVGNTLHTNDCFSNLLGFLGDLDNQLTRAPMPTGWRDPAGHRQKHELPPTTDHEI